MYVTVGFWKCPKIKIFENLCVSSNFVWDFNSFMYLTVGCL